MLTNPKPGQRIRVRYNKRLRTHMLYHDNAGRILIPSRGRPRNHLVALDDGTKTIIPCGNLFSEPESA